MIRNYSRKTHKLTWEKLNDGQVKVRLTSKLTGDIHYGIGRNIAEAIQSAIRSEAWRPKFKPSTILRRKKDD